jgi:hypothetical protein
MANLLVKLLAAEHDGVSESFEEFFSLLNAYGNKISDFKASERFKVKNLGPFALNLSPVF